MKLTRRIHIPAWLLLAVFAASLLAVTQAAAQPVAVPAAPPGADAYLAQRNWFWAGQQLLSLLIPGIILFSGLGARLRDGAVRIARGNWYGTLTLTGILVLIVSAVLSLPYDYWRGYASMPMMAPHLKEWWTGEAAGLLTRCAAAILFFWIPYGLMVRSPRRWWLYAGAAAVPLTFVALIALPVWVDPLTTAYHPLTDRKLYAEIEQLAARCGVDHIPVFVGGDDTTVVGLGPTNRIILDENWFPIRKPDQLRFTVGHELKHYVIGDNYASIAVIAGALLLGFFATQMFGRMLIARFHRRFGFDALSDPASLPLSILILTFSWLCILPFFNWYARHIEFEADRFGLELTRENHALAQAQANMIAGGDMPDWGPFFMIFRATHPTNGDRIRLANSYKPWEQGKPLVYGDVCKPPS